MNNSPLLPIKPKRSRAKRSLKAVDLEQLEKKLLTVLEREVHHLLDLSLALKLEKEDALSLGNYLKLLKTLKKTDDIDNLSDAELQKIANKE